MTGITPRAFSRAALIVNGQALLLFVASLTVATPAYTQEVANDLRRCATLRGVINEVSRDNEALRQGGAILERDQQIRSEYAAATAEAARLPAGSPQQRAALQRQARAAKLMNDNATIKANKVKIQELEDQKKALRCDALAAEGRCGTSLTDSEWKNSVTDLNGAGRHGASTWKITGATAEETTGMAKATGSAQVSPEKIVITWTSPDKRYAGNYDIDLQPGCESGEGKLTLTTDADKRTEPKYTAKFTRTR